MRLAYLFAVITVLALAFLLVGCGAGGVAAPPAMATVTSPAFATQTITPAGLEDCPDPEGVATLCPDGPGQVSDAQPVTLEPRVEPVLTGTPVATSTPLPSTPETLQQPGPTPAAPSPTPCAPEICYEPHALVLNRPIAPDGMDQVDPTYSFGSTAGGQRDPHHGVEFLNSFGTPVLAASPGKVVVAGDDRRTFYGPYSYFYGNLVVIQHALPGIHEPVYTLYGHLSEIEVEEGQVVETGQEIGKVGMTGVATGSHLHFEVRLGENTYAAARNPELWLKPHANEEGVLNGALAGRIGSPQGYLYRVSSIVLEYLGDNPEDPAQLEYYIQTYEEKTLLGQPPYEETFAIGDIPAGWYRLSFIQNGYQIQLVQVLPGQLTIVQYTLGE